MSSSMRRNHLLAIMISSFLLIVITTLVLSCAASGKDGSAAERKDEAGKVAYTGQVDPPICVRTLVPGTLPASAHLPGR